MKRRFLLESRNFRLWALILCLLMTFGKAGDLLAAVGTTPVTAQTDAYKDNEDQLVATEEEKELFTLAQVRDMSRSRGSETRKAKADLEIAKASKDAADMAVHNAWNAVLEVASSPLPQMGGGAQAEAALTGAYAAQENAGISLDDAKATAESQAEISAYKGEELYFAYLQLQGNLAILDKASKLSREQVRIEELKYKIGLSTAIEVQKKQLALAGALDTKQVLLNAIDLTGRSLLRQIGVADDTVFRLESSYSIEGLTTVYDPSQLAELAVKNSLTIGVLDRSIDKMGDMITDGMAPSTRSQVGSQRDSLILTRDNAIQAMKLLARTTATGLDSARTEMDILEESVRDKQTAYDIASLQVSLGLAPKILVASSELELLTAQNELKTAKQNYYLSLRKASLLVKGVAVI